MLMDFDLSDAAEDDSMEIFVYGEPAKALSKGTNKPKISKKSSVQKAKPAKKSSSRWYKELPIVKSLHALADAGFTVTNRLIQSFVTDYVQANAKLFAQDNPFLPGPQLVPHFLKRHPELAQRMSENRSVAPERVPLWFASVTRYLEKMRLQNVLQNRRQVFTMDDTILRRDKSDVTFTCLFGASAYGNLLPPLVLFPDAIKVPTPNEQFQLSYVVAYEHTELTAGNAFYQWLTRVFQPWLSKEKIPQPVILFVDGHRHQISYLTSQFCQQRKIVLVSLPSRSAHMQRPLNVKLFERINQLFHLDTSSSTEPPHIKPMLDQISDVKNIIQAGFYQSKLFPWNSSNDAQPRPRVRKDPAQTDVEMGLATFRRMLESRLPAQLVAEFQAHRYDAVWHGPVEQTSLFRVWRDSLHEVDATEPEPRELGEGEVSLEGSETDLGQEDTGECLLDFVKEEPMVGYEDEDQ